MKMQPMRADCPTPKVHVELAKCALVVAAYVVLSPLLLVIWAHNRYRRSWRKS